MKNSVWKIFLALTALIASTSCKEHEYNYEYHIINDQPYEVLLKYTLDKNNVSYEETLRPGQDTLIYLREGVTGDDIWDIETALQVYPFKTISAIRMSEPADTSKNLKLRRMWEGVEIITRLGEDCGRYNLHLVDSVFIKTLVVPKDPEDEENPDDEDDSDDDDEESDEDNESDDDDDESESDNESGESDGEESEDDDNEESEESDGEEAEDDDNEESEESDGEEAEDDDNEESEEADGEESEDDDNEESEEANGEETEDDDNEESEESDGEDDDNEESEESDGEDDDNEANP